MNSVSEKLRQLKSAASIHRSNNYRLLNLEYVRLLEGVESG